MFFSRGTVRYEERGQGYRDVEKAGKYCLRVWLVSLFNSPNTKQFLSRKVL